MIKSTQSLILIGMPGAGKSTIGVLLAKLLVKEFVDTDLLIQTREAKSLQAILDYSGFMALRKAEEEVLLSLPCENHIVATGGSAVYSQKAMVYLKQFGQIVFLDVSMDELQNRIANASTRGIAKPETQSFAELFLERHPLYLQYADVVIKSEQKTVEEIVQAIVAHVLTPNGDVLFNG